MEKFRILIVKDGTIIVPEVESQLQGIGYYVSSNVDPGKK
jgi:hypothetical protein